MMSGIQIIFMLALSMLVTIILMPYVIRYFRKKQLGQTTRNEGPKWHAAKSGTPTMGGVAIIISASFAAIVFSILVGQFNTVMILLLFIFVLYGLIGFFDDYIKVVMKRNLGLTSLQKLIAQIIGGILFYIGISMVHLPTSLYIPLLGNIDFGIFYALFIIFWLVGFSNATNLTDGIDGLLASTGTIAFATYALIAYIQNQMDIFIFALSVVGSLIGFFFFNKKPAKIFMGDVGSLALGAALASMSILLKQEWTLLLIGLIFVVETASVMLQVFVYKRTGKRIFKMSPIHHHFEMSGYGEWKIVGVFSAIALICTLATLLILL